MATNATTHLNRDHRRHRRLPFAGRVQYCYGQNESGTGQWRDIGGGGAAVRLSRYLRPGTFVLLTLDEHRRELKARVAWCAQLDGTTDFVAGLKVFRDDPEAATLMRKLTDAAMDRAWQLPAEPVHWASQILGAKPAPYAAL